MKRHTRRKLNRYGRTASIILCDVISLSVIFGLGYLFWIGS